MSLPTVSVIVPTFQRAPALRRTLVALSALDYPADLREIIVVDDGSTDGTGEVVAGLPQVNYVRQPNSGVAVARNHGASLSSGEILMFVDDDIVVAADNVRRHLAVRAEYGDCIVSGHSEFDPDVRAALARTPFGRYRLWTEDLAQAGLTSPGDASGRIHPPTVATGNITIARETFSRLGGFDERFPVGAEDQDLCLRARAAGCAIVHDFDIRVIHNDQHADLLSLCRREERGAVGAVCLARKHPELPAPPALALNGPLSASDRPRVVVRKLVRSVLSQPWALWAARRLVGLAEAVHPDGGRPLTWLYRSVTGLYVFRGVRRGYQVTAGNTWLPAHRAD
jgi:GT2 family glycosyltransferase